MCFWWFSAKEGQEKKSKDWTYVRLVLLHFYPRLLLFLLCDFRSIAFFTLAGCSACLLMVYIGSDSESESESELDSDSDSDYDSD